MQAPPHKPPVRPSGARAKLSRLNTQQIRERAQRGGLPDCWVPIVLDLCEEVERLQSAKRQFLVAFSEWQEAEGWDNAEWDDVIDAVEKLKEMQ